MLELIPHCKLVLSPRLHSNQLDLQPKYQNWIEEVLAFSRCIEIRLEQC
jgi:hypothetical protein